MITIVDYGMGNLGSIHNMLNRIGVESVITGDRKQIQDAEKLILPGVGSFDAAMLNIRERDLYDILEIKACEDQIPILGICLGMQLLTCSSEEGKEKGFGWIKAKTKKFPTNQNLKVPHMGWNNVFPSNQDSELLADLEENSRFYFVHSYFVEVENKRNSILTCNYGFEFDAAIQKDNIFGVQFHPEKSHKFGISLLTSFTIM